MRQIRITKTPRYSKSAEAECRDVVEENKEAEALYEEVVERAEAPAEAMLDEIEEVLKDNAHERAERERRLQELEKRERELVRLEAEEIELGYIALGEPVYPMAA